MQNKYFLLCLIASVCAQPMLAMEPKEEQKKQTPPTDLNISFINLSSIQKQDDQIKTPGRQAAQGSFEKGMNKFGSTRDKKKLEEKHSRSNSPENTPSKKTLPQTKKPNEVEKKQLRNQVKKNGNETLKREVTDINESIKLDPTGTKLIKKDRIVQVEQTVESKKPNGTNNFLEQSQFLEQKNNPVIDTPALTQNTTPIIISKDGESVTESNNNSSKQTETPEYDYTTSVSFAAHYVPNTAQTTESLTTSQNKAQSAEKDNVISKNANNQQEIIDQKTKDFNEKNQPQKIATFKKQQSNQTNTTDIVTPNQENNKKQDKSEKKETVLSNLDGKKATKNGVHEPSSTKTTTPFTSMTYTQAVGTHINTELHKFLTPKGIATHPDTYTALLHLSHYTGGDDKLAELLHTKFDVAQEATLYALTLARHASTRTSGVYHASHCAPNAKYRGSNDYILSHLAGVGMHAATEHYAGEAIDNAAESLVNSITDFVYKDTSPEKRAFLTLIAAEAIKTAPGAVVQTAGYTFEHAHALSNTY